MFFSHKVKTTLVVIKLSGKKDRPFTTAVQKEDVWVISPHFF